MADTSDYWIDPSLQDRASVSITHVTTTATVTHSSHGYSTSDTVKMYGATQSAYNGYFVITVTGANTYTYTMLSDPGANATGSPTASKVNFGAAGTLGDPFADLQYTMNSEITRDATNGDSLYLIPGTDEILVGIIEPDDGYGTPNSNGPLNFIGSSGSIQNSQAGIDGNAGNFSISTASHPHIKFFNLHLHNTGTAPVIGVGNLGCGYVECEVDTSTGGCFVNTSAIASVISCYMHSFDGNGVDLAGGEACFNYIVPDGSSGATRAIRFGAGSLLEHYSISMGNIVTLNNDTNGITTGGSHLASIIGNIVLSTVAGTLRGIAYSNAKHGGIISGNLVEGFSGTGGAGIELLSGKIPAYGHNSVYDCTDAFVEDSGSAIYYSLGGNETLTESPFAKSGTNSYLTRHTYFHPRRVGSLFQGDYPSGSRQHRGAVGFSAAVSPGLQHFLGD